MKNLPIVLALLTLSLTCAGQSETPTDHRGLKDYYQSYFPIGVAVSPQALTGPEAELIKKQFNSLTAENVMKMGPIHPGETRYNWDPADQIVNFAVANQMKVRGHTLCWHNQTPDWFFKDANGQLITKEVLLQRLKEHITTVVSRYKGKIYAWDVVNEVIDDSPDVFYRPSPFFNIAGEEFIAKAFQYAHEADPDAILFYNDYNTENPVKREKILKLVKGLKDAGVPIHAVGLQGHWSIYDPTAEAIDESIKKFAALGFKVQITELDVSVYKSEQGRREKNADEPDQFTPEMEKRQAELYAAYFRVFRKYKSFITGVTFWNVSDRRSWLDNFPVRGRKNYPLLFDQQLRPKKAYEGVVKW